MKLDVFQKLVIESAAQRAEKLVPELEREDLEWLTEKAVKVFTMAGRELAIRDEQSRQYFVGSDDRDFSKIVFMPRPR